MNYASFASLSRSRTTAGIGDSPDSQRLTVRSSRHATLTAHSRADRPEASMTARNRSESDGIARIGEGFAAFRTDLSVNDRTVCRNGHRPQVCVLLAAVRAFALRLLPAAVLRGKVGGDFDCNRTGHVGTDSLRHTPLQCAGLNCPDPKEAIALSGKCGKKWTPALLSGTPERPPECLA